MHVPAMQKDNWAGNSGWIAFSNKRRDGEFTRIYLSLSTPVAESSVHLVYT